MLLEASKRIRTFEHWRWAMFDPQELKFIKKALEPVLLNLHTGSSVTELARCRNLLTGLEKFLRDYYFS
jgi:hypothetical protein